jgi:hypothetical protein
MPSTYSPLKIELPATGEQSGTWGNTTNTNLGTALEEAIVGSADVTFTNGNDTTVTLTDSNASQVARNLRLNLIGSSNAAQSLILGSGCQIEKLYLVNNTLGHDITVKNTSGTGIVVPAGKTMFVYNNGTNVVEAVNSAVTLDVTTLDATNIEVTNIKAKDGTASATIANSTGVMTVASSVLTTTDINGGTIDNTAIGASTPAAGTFTQVDIVAQGDLRLQDTTGGQYVALQAPGTIASSYTLTLPVDDGTSGQALITDGSGVLSWSTAAAGDVYGPASATDNAIARFDGTTGKIIQNSAVTIADTTGDITTAGYLITAAGAVGTPALTTTGDTNTGIFFPAADTIAFTEGGVESMRIDSSGRLGIGTSSPSTRLTINAAYTSSRGQLSIVGASDEAGLSFYNDSTFNGIVNFSNSSGYLGTVSNTPLFFSTNNAERMRITSTGNVGIGTSTPDFLLEIKSNNTANQGLKIWGASPDGTKNSNIYFGDNAGTNAYVMRFVNVFGGGSGEAYGLNLRSLNTSADFTVVAGTEGSPITGLTLKGNSGNVGIGTASPASYGSSKLAVVGGELGLSNTSDARFYLYTDTTVRGLLYADATRIQLEASGTNPLTLWTNSGERARINSSGQLLINTTDGTASYLDGRIVAIAATGKPALTLQNDNGGGQFNASFWGTATTGDNIFVNFLTEASPTVRGSIDYNRAGGQVRYNTTSDERLKENIVDSSSALPLINAVKIRSFDWKETGFHVKHGVIAQELKIISPDSVSVGQDNEDGTIKQPWGVDTATLVPAIIKAIQELKAELDSVKAELQILKGA